MCARHLPRLRSAQPHYGHTMQREGDSRGAKRVGERRRAVTTGAIPYRRVQNPRRPSQGTEDSSRDVPER